MKHLLPAIKSTLSPVASSNMYSFSQRISIFLCVFESLQMSLLGQGDREAEIEVEILKYTLLFGLTKE